MMRHRFNIEESRLRGLLQGHKNIETGHIQNIGRLQGLLNVQSGHLERIKTHEVLSRGGRTAGLLAVASGHLERVKTPESLSKGGTAGCHSRWHVARGIFNSKCEVCIKEANENAFAENAGTGNPVGASETEVRDQDHTGT
jgi:hypothetical protein